MTPEKEGKNFGVRQELEQAAATVAIQGLPIAELNDNPYQKLARPTVVGDVIHGIDELANSIKANGFYGALLARPARDGNGYELAFGHRRREAARRAGYTMLPVKVLELTDNQMARIMASENFSREDLTPLGEARIIGLLQTNQHLSARAIAEIIGKGQAWVELRVMLHNAPQDVKAMVELRPYTLGHAKLLIQVADATVRRELILQVVGNNLTRSQLEAAILAKTIADMPAQPVATPSSSPTAPTTDLVPDEDDEEWFEALNKLNEALSELEGLAGVGAVPAKTVPSLEESRDRLNQLLEK